MPVRQQIDPGLAYYFGTYLDAGHYLWDAHWKQMRFPNFPDPGWTAYVPWPKIDGALCPMPGGRYPNDGEAALHHRDGWTALAFGNYTDDKRPNSNAVFFLKGAYDFEKALALAKEVFPHVFERFDFEIRLVEGAKAA